MKINTIKYIGIVAFILVIISCSTKKDRFVNRTFHAKAAKYNVLYNGGVALETGLKDLGITILIAMVSVLWFEGYKWIYRR